MCGILEDEMEFFTLTEFQAKMEEQHENVYSPLMTKKKLQEKYTEKKLILFLEMEKVTLSYLLTLVALLQKHGIMNEKFLKQIRQRA